MSIDDYKILIADDSALVRKQITDIVKKAGNPVFIEAKDGPEAVKILRDDHVDIAFMDICMPGLDGIGVLKQMQNYAHKPQVIVVSSLGTKDTIMDALMHGANDFIQKPFTEEKLINALEKSLQKITKQ